MEPHRNFKTDSVFFHEMMTGRQGFIQMSDLFDLQTHSLKPDRWMFTLVGMLPLLVGGLVLLGWQFDVAFLKSPNPEWVSMKPNAALCLILIGLAWIAGTGAASPISKWLSRVCASLVGLAGLLSLAEYLLKIDFGTGQLLFIDSPDAVGTSHLGRLAPDAALCFILLATAIWLSTLKRAIWHFFALAVLGTLVVSVSLADILLFHSAFSSTYSIAHYWGGADDDGGSDGIAVRLTRYGDNMGGLAAGPQVRNTERKCRGVVRLLERSAGGFSGLEPASGI